MQEMAEHYGAAIIPARVRNLPTLLGSASV